MMCTNPGNKKTSVFPVPVCAMPTMSRPCKTTGQPWHCTGVGFSNPARTISSRISATQQPIATTQSCTNIGYIHFTSIKSWQFYTGPHAVNWSHTFLIGADMPSGDLWLTELVASDLRYFAKPSWNVLTGFGMGRSPALPRFLTCMPLLSFLEDIERPSDKHRHRKKQGGKPTTPKEPDFFFCLCSNCCILKVEILLNCCQSCKVTRYSLTWHWHYLVYVGNMLPCKIQV